MEYKLVMKLRGAFICIFKGHTVSTKCQTALKKSSEGIHVTKCERCDYPLRLELINNDRFYAVEIDSAKELCPEKFK
jgi:hypothetical protein